MSVTRFDFERSQIAIGGLEQGTLVSAKYILDGAHVLRSRALLLTDYLLERCSLLLALSSLPLEARHLQISLAEGTLRGASIVVVEALALINLSSHLLISIS